MRKLLASNWFIARKNRIVVLVCVVMLAIAAFASVNNAHERIWAQEEYNASGTQSMEPPSVGFERIALTTIPAIGIAFAFVISTLVNDEFSGGRIRDKIIGGVSRAQAYFSSFLSSFFVCALITGCVLAGDFAAAGLVDWSATQTTPSSYLLTVGLILLNTAAWSSMFTLIGMLVCGRGSGSGVVCLIVSVIVFIALLMTYAQIDSMLMEPEFIEDYIFSDSGVDVGSSYPNPAYLNDADRAFWETVQISLPVGQATRLIGFEPTNPPIMAASSALITLICWLVGAGLFRRRDLN